VTEDRIHVRGVSASKLILAYESFGAEAADAILFVSGLATQMIRWTTPFCRALAARGYRVIRFDNRDSGRSSHFAQHGPVDFGQLVSRLMSGQDVEVAYTLGDMADDALALLDALSIRRAHVVGRSMGGMIAQILASEHASRVSSLTTIMSATGNPAMPPAKPDVMAMLTQPGADAAVNPSAFIEQGVRFARRIAGSAYPFDEEDCRSLLRQELDRGHVAGGLGRQLAAIAVAGDRRRRLATIAVPTLVVHGLDDPLVPPACGVDTAQSIPGSEWMPVAGMGHDIPALLYGTIIDAIERTARRGNAA